MVAGRCFGFIFIFAQEPNDTAMPETALLPGFGKELRMGRLNRRTNSPESTPQVISVNISSGGIPKLPVAFACLALNGLEGDGHNHEKHNNPLQAVCLQDIEELEELCKEGFPLNAGSTGENLTVKNLNVNNLPLGTVLKFSGGVVIELTKVRKPCYVLDAIDPHLQEIIADCCGMYAKVLQEGVVKEFDHITVVRNYR